MSRRSKAAALGIFLFLAAALAPTPARADEGSFRYQVRHDHDPWGSCRGELLISEQGIDFESRKSGHSRSWKWIDVQSFDRQSEDRFSIMTWRDERWKLGRDKEFDFTILPGTEALSDKAFALIREHLGRPLTDRVPLQPATDYEVPVKHRHKTGGCQGVLRFGPEWVVFESENPRHSRSWRRGLDIESFWSSGPYHFEIHSRTATGWFKSNKHFRFQLKKPLNQEYYEQLRREVAAPVEVWGGG